eukprot:CAMPEP_0171127408 /NCGR_PEP_ID=MMETSP0766_2-20121228/115194_1 /TAXON_ID=439317 /ORGANISM="Gambierdiscus australes, Strain CAWD 149" /LENGTH=304 /DNA_ID=CAMNT_0011590503 /DNA_START=54 /DNA_END=964 /DNA_ORIENTATION=-
MPSSVAFVLLSFVAAASPSDNELAALLADDACSTDAESEACAASLRQLRGLKVQAPARANRSDVKGFCCYAGARQDDQCGTCFDTGDARAEVGSYCAFENNCEGCGGQWCKSVCVMGYENPNDICGSAYETGIAKSDDFCASSAEECAKCKGHWCGQGKKTAPASTMPEGGGFCCYGASDEADTCGSCYPTAIAQAGDTCASASTCSGCGGTWCKASCVMSSADPAKPCSTAYESSIAESTDFCAKSKEHCNDCKGTWCTDGQIAGTSPEGDIQKEGEDDGHNAGEEEGGIVGGGADADADADA